MRQRPVLIAIAGSMICGAALAAEGLVPPADEIWSRWQGRISVSATVLSPLGTDIGAAGRSALQSGALFSDYYFDTPGLRLPASYGGLRATGGLLVGPRGLAQGGVARPLQRLGLSVQSGSSPLASDGNSDTVPYLGVGYTGLSLKGGWGITADLGLVAENSGRVGRALFGNSGQSWDSAIRDIRLSPVLQVGVSYAF